MTGRRARVMVRPTTRADFPGIIALCERVYPGSPPWSERQLASHLEIFPEGQFVAIRPGEDVVVGMAASLIVHWDDYETTGSWRDFTDVGMFTNHDPAGGRTLYGAEVMVDPKQQRSGIGSALYRARVALACRLKLRRIRAAARLRGYHRHAARLSAQEYVERVVRGEIKDPTLSFQLAQGFRVIRVVSSYLRHDPDSLGYAAVIEWLNPDRTTPADAAGRDPRYEPRP